ncbi:MAG: hypothetical protein II868_00985 [Butyrivibrio sp.]|nr:hypothetical protein [Butyrivibrio sp.]
MSEREQAFALLEQVPEYKMTYVIAFLRGASIPDEIPNAETLAAFEEIENGGGEVYDGTTHDIFASVLSE